MNKRNKQKGITLIALIITIIILLILAGTAISIAVNGGDLFSKTSQAREEWNQSVAREEQIISEWFDLVESTTGVKQVNDSNPGILEGSGTEEDPWTINCIEDLVAFSYSVNIPDTPYYKSYENEKIILGLSLDFKDDKSYADPSTKYINDSYGYKKSEDDTGTPIKELLNDKTKLGFIPISNGLSNGFGGIFDGNKHILYNLFINSSRYGGLFGYTQKPTTISNIGLRDCNITGNNYTGGILGYSTNKVDIANSYMSGQVESNNFAGGIAGFINSPSLTITECYNIGKVQGHTTYTGGIIGFCNASTSFITDCYNSGEVQGTSYVGGIIGLGTASLTVSNCYNDSELIKAASSYVGGIIGLSDGTITINTCYNKGNIISEGSCLGGIVGKSVRILKINDCHNSGNVSCRSSTTGGIVGYTSNYAEITNCYNDGTVSNRGTPLGGIVGYANEGIKIISCYNTADIIQRETGCSIIGGIIGEGYASAYVANCYNTGDILDTVNYSYYIGGLVGKIGEGSSILNCYNTGNVQSGGRSCYCAGIAETVGTRSSVINCYNSGEISCVDHFAAGIVCYNPSTITNCYNAGNVTADPYNHAGGIVQTSDATISYCYNSGNISGGYAGGISASYNSSVSNCHNTGDISSPSVSPDSYFGEWEITGEKNCRPINPNNTYLLKTINATPSGATGVANMEETMSMSNFVARMNSYVASNNSNSYNVQLKTWKVEDGRPVFND